VGKLVRFDPEIGQGHSPVSKRSNNHGLVSCQARRSFRTRTNDVDVRVGSGSAIVVVGEGESALVLVGELGLGADTCETPWGVGPKWTHEYHLVFSTWSYLLSGSGMGVGATILLNGLDVRVGPQNLQVSVGEGSSETVDDGPFVRDLGLGADLAGDGRDTSIVGSAVLEGDDVTSGNGIPGLLDGDEGGGSGEDWEKTEEKSDELLGEHGGRLELWNLSFSE